MTPSRLFTIDEAAEFLRVSRRQIYNLMEQGELPVVKVGSRTRIDIEAYLAAKSSR